MSIIYPVKIEKDSTREDLNKKAFESKVKAEEFESKSDEKSKRAANYFREQQKVYDALSDKDTFSLADLDGDGKLSDQEIKFVSSQGNFSHGTEVTIQALENIKDPKNSLNLESLVRQNSSRESIKTIINKLHPRFTKLKEQLEKIISDEVFVRVDRNGDDKLSSKEIYKLTFAKKKPPNFDNLPHKEMADFYKLNIDSIESVNNLDFPNIMEEIKIIQKNDLNPNFNKRVGLTAENITLRAKQLENRTTQLERSTYGLQRFSSLVTGMKFESTKKFEKLDADGNGRVTYQELSAGWREAMSSNDGGIVSYPEIISEELFNALVDDGALTKENLDETVKKIHKLVNSQHSLIDKYLESATLLEKLSERFDAVDINNDDILSDSEIEMLASTDGVKSDVTQVDIGYFGSRVPDSLKRLN